MQNYRLDQIEQFKELNLLDENNNIQLSDANIQRLKEGGITDEVQLENVQIDGEYLNFNAKLSLYEDEHGEARLTVHPVFKEHQNSSQLSNEENKYFRDEKVHSKDVIAVGTITDYGSAPYKNNPENQESYFITLQKRNGQLSTIWGIELAKTLSLSGKVKGDKIVLENKGTENVVVKVAKRDKQGNEIGYDYKRSNKNLFAISEYKEEAHKELKDKNVLFQYDKETKSFKKVNPDKVDLVAEINGHLISETEKERLKKGEMVQLDDETSVEISPKKGKSFISNKALLITSLMLDGGICYLLIKTAEKVSKEKIEKDNIYSKGYVAALNKLKAELLQKQAQYPNNVRIERDLNIVSGEISKVNTKPIAQTVDAAKEQKAKDIKLNVHDPDTYQDAKREREEMAQDAGEQSTNERVEMDAEKQVGVEMNEERSYGRKM
ncbi:MAG: DUF3945 domain-containing protein [Bacteroidia bacterium]|nr:DUF3945 domain-containing protein [Bacteroidia bacterium]